ncbi:hypothetical protein [Microbulbifer sp. GL-2]|uniref:hypothetical protein n=1 Tax=Microbulbifer sp. GL-2 TaxID=2591606 RepID=UPI0011645373|nr:hypothetical protein [Microbulbifer sp. GL-2]BBM02055.1 hypothetical protein GL2_21290 [Microbulbifer sp. GL-2]
MKLSRPIRIILGVLILPPLLLGILLVIALVWPTDPLPIEEVFLGVCGDEFKSEYVVGDRPHSYSIAPQGAWYDETSEIKVSPEAATKIYNKLSDNNEFTYKDGYFEKFVVGKILANCKINTESGQIQYTYVLW